MKKKLMIIIPLVLLSVVEVILLIKPNNSKDKEDNSAMGDTNIIYDSDRVDYDNSLNDAAVNTVQNAIDRIYGALKGGCYVGFNAEHYSKVDEYYLCKPYATTSPTIEFSGRNVKYDNSSGIESGNVQGALDEIISRVPDCKEHYAPLDGVSYPDIYKCVQRVLFLSQYTSNAYLTLRNYNSPQMPKFNIYNIGVSTGMDGATYTWDYVSRFNYRNDAIVNNGEGITTQIMDTIYANIIRDNITPLRSVWYDGSKASLGTLSPGIYYVSASNVPNGIDIYSMLIYVRPDSQTVSEELGIFLYHEDSNS